MGKQFIASNSFLDLCDILYNCRQKKMHSFYEIGILAFSFSVRLGYHAKQVKQKKAVLRRRKISNTDLVLNILFLT